MKLFFYKKGLIFMTTRKIKKLTTGQRTIDGAGVHLVRVLGHDTVMDYDPFLMLDSFDSHNPTDYIKGFPIHPHRGIETISYLVQELMLRNHLMFLQSDRKSQLRSLILTKQRRRSA